MQTHKIFAKLAAEPSPDFDQQAELIPVWHGWVSEKKLDGELLIDIHDYTHVPEGPGVILVGFEANYGLDEGVQGGLDGLGLAYNRKQPFSGDDDASQAARIRAALRAVARAAALIESEPALSGRVRFKGEKLSIGFNERLAPNTDETLEALRGALDEVLAPLFGDAGYELERDSDSRRRFGVTVSSEKSVSAAELLERLS